MKKILKFVPLILCFVSAVGMRQALALETFMRVSGIPGSSVRDGFKDWIDVATITQSMHQGANQPQCTVNVVKGLDISGPLLWAAAATNQRFSQIELVVANFQDGLRIVYTITLRNATIKNITTVGNAAGYGDSLMLGAQLIQLQYFPQRADGTTGSPITSSFAC